MNNHQAIIAMIKHISGQANVLTIPRVFIDLTGSVTSALFLSQCIYWSDRSGVGGGWFAKTVKEWHEETGLTRANVESAIRECSYPGVGEFVETKLARFKGAPTTHYRVDLDKLALSICRILQIEMPDQANGFAGIVQMDLYESSKTSTETTTNTSTEIKEDTDCAIAPATSPLPAPAKKRASSPDKPARKPKPAAPANPNTGPIQAAFVACLPPAMQSGFDYAATGRKAKALAGMGILPAHIATYFKMLREQWNKNPKMRDKAITFFDLSDYIMARAQNSALAHIHPAPDVPGVAVSLADELFRETIARMDAEAERELTPAELEAARLADDWKRLAQALEPSMTKAAFAQTFGRARIAAHEGTLVQIEIPARDAREWADTRMRPVVERAVRAVFAQGAVVEFVGGAS